jgi:hypothetical protein
MILTFFGCNQDQIKIVDENNNPLAGARVFSLSPSTQSEPGITNSNGIAIIHQVIGGNMLRIELAGFETAFVHSDPTPPALVTLKNNSH